MNEIDATPRDLHSDIEKLKYYTQLYQTDVLGNKIILFDVKNVQFPLLSFVKANIEMSEIFLRNYFQMSRHWDEILF